MDLISLILTLLIMCLFGIAWIVATFWWIIAPVLIIILLMQIRNQNRESGR